MNGVPIPPLEPGSPEWLQTMSASKVSTILGVNPWDSPYALWCRMAGKTEAEPQTTQQSRGHFLEPAIWEWFADKHPEYVMGAGGCWAHRDFPWWTAQPDGLGIHKTVEQPVVPLECKTSSSWGDDWGPSGTDEIPTHYRVQVMVQLDVLGAPYGHLAVLLAGLEFREYRIDYNPAEAQAYRDAAKDFLDSITADQPPPLDGSEWTYRALKQLPDGMEDRAVEVGRDVAEMLRAGAELAKGAERIRQEAANLVLAAIGNARRAYYVDDDGYRVPVATRAVKKDGTTHSLRVAPGLTVETTAA